MGKVQLDDDCYLRPATPRVVDFRHLKDAYYGRDDRGLMRVVMRNGMPFVDDTAPYSTESTVFDEGKKTGTPGTGLQSNGHQQRKRARRRLNKGERIVDEVWNELYKPLEEWDPEELARGRPRNANGDFRGRPPKYITRELHERAMERFKLLIRSEMNFHTINALKTVQMVLENDEVDAKGKPIVPASAKMDAAKFLLEHIVGKPTQPTTSDISIKLQGILGTVMVNPMEVAGQYTPAHTGSRELGGNIYDPDEEDEDGTTD